MKKFFTVLSLFAALTINAQIKTYTVTEYYDTGILKETGFIKNGLCDSTWIKYDKSGKIEAKAFYNNGTKVGTWEIYTPEKTIQIVYNKGKKEEYIELSEAGEILLSVKY